MIKQDWVNIHTHRAGPGICIADLGLVRGSMAGGGIVLGSLGIHPLFIGEDVEARLSVIRQEAAGGRLAAIGESGLDRNAVVTVERQEELFIRQAGLSELYGLPLIIHCVRAFPELLSIHRRLKPAQAWIIHGFDNNGEILHEILRHGLYVSAGKQMMNERSNLFRLVTEIPLERLFIETDDSDIPIEEIYRRVAERRGMEVAVLQQKIFENFRKLFNFAVH